MEPYLFAFGCGVSFLTLAGTYVWMRRGFVSGMEIEAAEGRRARTIELDDSESARP